MRLRIIFFPFKLYPFKIDICFKHWNTSCTLLKNYIHYSSLENLDFLKQYDYYLQLYIHLNGERKDNGNIVPISTYPEWILRGFKIFFSSYKCGNFSFEVFH
jgi:hypothetical protein